MFKRSWIHYVREDGHYLIVFMKFEMLSHVTFYTFLSNLQVVNLKWATVKVFKSNMFVTKIPQVNLCMNSFTLTVLKSFVSLTRYEFQMLTSDSIMGSADVL